MRAHWIIMVAAAFVVALGVPATAGMMGQMPPAGQAGGMGPGGMGGMMDHGMRGSGHRMGGHEGPLITMMLHHGHDLALSPEQEKQLRALRTEFSKESVRRNAEIRVLQIDVDALLEQDRWDLAQIEPKVKQIATLEGELRAARIKTLAQGRTLLTPQQLEKLKQLGHQMRSMGGPGGMGHGMRGPGGPGGPPAQPPTH
jgi:periplasmic protein CpxP/Spy